MLNPKKLMQVTAENGNQYRLVAGTNNNDGLLVALEVEHQDALGKSFWSPLPDENFSEFVCAVASSLYRPPKGKE